MSDRHEHGGRVQGGCACPTEPAGANLSQFSQDIVVFADPKLPPLWLLAAAKLLSQHGAVLTSTYVHSSVRLPPPELYRFFPEKNLDSRDLPHSGAVFKILLIWIRDVSVLNISKKMDSIHYFVRISDHYQNMGQCGNVNDWFDLVDGLANNDIQTRLDAVRSISNRLQKTAFVCGEQPHLMDAVILDALIGGDLLKAADIKMKKWVEACAAHDFFGSMAGCLYTGSVRQIVRAKAPKGTVSFYTPPSPEPMPEPLEVLWLDYDQAPPSLEGYLYGPLMETLRIVFGSRILGSILLQPQYAFVHRWNRTPMDHASRRIPDIALFFYDAENWPQSPIKFRAVLLVEAKNYTRTAEKDKTTKENAVLQAREQASYAFSSEQAYDYVFCMVIVGSDWKVFKALPLKSSVRDRTRSKLGKPALNPDVCLTPVFPKDDWIKGPHTKEGFAKLQDLCEHIRVAEFRNPRK